MAITRTILVTGASSGIGLAISERLLKEGCTVIGIARNINSTLNKQANFHAVEMDLANIDALPEQLRSLEKEYPNIGGVICCAGRGQFGSLEEFSYSQIRSLMDLNFTSHTYIVRTFLPGMKKKGFGDVVFIGSEAALSGGRKGAIYCASKFALRGLAQALRDECARSGVRVSIINPGMVKTEFFKDLNFEPGDEEDNYILPEDVADATAMIIKARPGTVFDEINLSPQKKVIRSK